MTSIVIPVFNEAQIINARVRHVRSIAEGDPVEIIVADGGPNHLTLAALDDPTVIKVACSPGRGTQMNAGASRATGEYLVFLHADTDLPQGALSTVKRTLAGRAVAGAFSLSIDSNKMSLAVVAWFANVRSRIERIPYGDQAQFMTASLFWELGGFADVPIMEDVELFQKIRKMGLPIAIGRSMVVTSPRRWEREGVLRRTLTNWLLRIRYCFGTSPEVLKTHYRPQRGATDDK